MSWTSVFGMPGRLDDVVITERTRHVASVHLILAGAVNVLLGLVILTSVGTEQAAGWLMTGFGLVLTESQLLDRTDMFLFTARYLLPALGVYALGIGIVQGVVGGFAMIGRYYVPAIASAILGALTLVALPLSAIAIVLLPLSRNLFE